MKTERELYQQHYKTSRDYKFYVKHEMTEKQIFEFNNGKYSVDCVNDGWKIWQASASREGYKLVPLEPTQDMVDKAVCDTPETPSQDYWHGSQPISDDQAIACYKAMIGACDG